MNRLNISRFLLILFCFACSAPGRPKPQDQLQKKKEVKEEVVPQRKKLTELTQREIRKYAEVNSCYFALLKDPSFFSPDYNAGFEVADLYNKFLPSKHPYRNRFLVGDFMALNESLEPRGISEINPILSKLKDFEGMDEEFFRLLDAAEFSNANKEEFFAYIRTNHSKDTAKLFNFYEKIWKYKTPPLTRTYAINNGKYYAAGQRLCLCEAKEDTLELVAQFATSSQRDGSTPIGARRGYYASHYYIGSKNWDRQRRYEPADLEHDKLMGGGSKHVTYFRGNVELSNFLLMKPDTGIYPRAMLSNGIHEVALRNLPRGMLGCANSIGCIRLSDFASKFVRWWIPMKANFFVAYRDDRYFKKMDETAVLEELPFKNEEEGNQFRAWLLQNYPFKAKQLEIDSSGSFDNGYILDAYNLYGAEYEKQRKK